MLSKKLAVFILFSALVLTAKANSSIEDCDAPVISAIANGIVDQYIVVLKDGVSHEEAKKIQETVASNGARILSGWSNKGSKRSSSKDNFQGFSISVDGKKRSALLRKAKKNCGVKYIEQDQWVKAAQINCKIQQNAGWCLARIPNNTKDQFPNPSSGGAGAVIYVIDTGCNPDHPDLRGRVKGTENFFMGEDGKDYNGHGTACASMAAGTTCGVAKHADIYCLKVLGSDGRGPSSNIVNAIVWVAKRADKGIISLSLGGGYSKSINDAADHANKQGHLAVVAAGNDNSDAQNTSPASTPSAITVAASDINNNMAGYSNFGSVVDIIAPGTNCKGADVHTNGYKTFVGTSMSTPYVAGVCALIQVQNNWLNSPDAPELITKKLLSMARNNVLRKMKPRTVNKLLYYNQCKSERVSESVASPSKGLIDINIKL